MKPYTDYSDFLGRLFPGKKVQKLSIDAGHSCPNRDGTLGTGGCLYCNNKAFSPSYCHAEGSVRTQIQEGKKFFARKYPQMQFLAYFQAYTSTYAPLQELLKAYAEAMESPDICGLVIGTRPDCMSDALLSSLVKIHTSRMPVIVEYGVESLHNRTLTLIHRRHSAECAVNTILRTRQAGLPVGAHIIMGLPSESRADMLSTVRGLSALGVDVLKFHQLQIVKDTPLHTIWCAQQNDAPIPSAYKDFPEINTFSVEEYLDLCAEIVKIVPRTTVIERFTAQCPPQLLAAPRWGLKNYQFVHLLQNRLKNTL